MTTALAFATAWLWFIGGLMFAGIIEKENNGGRLSISLSLGLVWPILVPAFLLVEIARQLRRRAAR